MVPMANVEKKNFVSPAWPTTAREHAVTELSAPFAGAPIPFGDDMVLPRPVEELGYVHPYTRINR